jgi:hypothetical protein
MRHMNFSSVHSSTAVLVLQHWLPTLGGKPVWTAMHAPTPAWTGHSVLSTGPVPLLAGVHNDYVRRQGLVYHLELA